MIEADYVICTASIGVLKSFEIQFTPQLPADKLTRIDQMLMNKFIKICLYFPENFWGDATFIAFMAEDYPMSLNLDAQEHLKGSKVL